MTKVYVTKYALTTGIRIVETDSDLKKQMIAFKDGSSGYTSYVFGNDWHTTPEEAVACAEKMRLKKIASLEKSLTRIRALTFDLTSLKK